MIIFDLDSVVYRVGFPADRKQYLVVGFDEDDNPIDQGFFDKKSEAQVWGDTFPSYSLEEQKDPDPLPHVLHSVKVVVQKALDRCHDWGPDRILYLSGPGNFRTELATLRTYKGNRSQEAPSHYFNIRHYLVEEWGALVVEGREADDQCSIQAAESRANGDKYIVISIDKDLDMIPGYHYNFVRDTFYHMTDLEGTQHFYKQLLMGDQTDNIPGCYRVGKSSKHLDVIDGLHSEQEMWAYIEQVYRDSMENEKCPYRDLDLREVILENARLLWMQTEPNQLWTPPGEPWEYLESFE